MYLLCLSEESSKQIRLLNSQGIKAFTKALRKMQNASAPQVEQAILD